MQYLDLRSCESSSRTVSKSSQVMIHVLKDHVDFTLVLVIII